MYEEVNFSMETNIEINFPFKLNLSEVIPLLKLPSNRNRDVNTWDLKQKRNLVIFFNHGVKCGQCMKKAIALAKVYETMKELETEVLSVSFDALSDLRATAILRDIPFPMLSDLRREMTEKFTYVHLSRNGPHPSIFITDRYGELRKQEISDEADQLLSEAEVLSWLRLIENECPECSHL